MNQPPKLRAYCSVIVVALLSGCIEQTPTPDDAETLHVRLVDTSPAPPSYADGICQVFAPRLNAVELLGFTDEPAVSVMKHVGQSMRDCLDGSAALVSTQVEGFFEQHVRIAEGDCPTGVACYWYNSSTIMLDREQMATTGMDRQHDQSLLGHELYHAVAGAYHP